MENRFQIRNKLNSIIYKYRCNGEHMKATDVGPKGHLIVQSWHANLSLLLLSIMHFSNAAFR